MPIINHLNSYPRFHYAGYSRMTGNTCLYATQVRSQAQYKYILTHEARGTLRAMRPECTCETMNEYNYLHLMIRILLRRSSSSVFNSARRYDFICGLNRKHPLEMKLCNIVTFILFYYEYNI